MLYSCTHTLCYESVTTRAMAARVLFFYSIYCVIRSKLGQGWCIAPSISEYRTIIVDFRSWSIAAIFPGIIAGLVRRHGDQQQSGQRGADGSFKRQTPLAEESNGDKIVIGDVRDHTWLRRGLCHDSKAVSEKGLGSSRWRL